MFNIESQENYHYNDLTLMHAGVEREMSQLGPSLGVSSVQRFQTSHVGYVRYRYGNTYDQHTHAQKGFIAFGVLDSDNPNTWLYEKFVPNNSLLVFRHNEETKAVLPPGFKASNIYFNEGFMTDLVQQVYRRSLSSVIPASGAYTSDEVKLGAVRAELLKWQQMGPCGADRRPAIVKRREESLALAIIEVLVDERQVEETGSKIPRHSVTRALELIHGCELENISAAELCIHAGCSQRALELNFRERVGVTPKKYIKYLRLASVHTGLQNFEAHGYESIIELAGINGFWHMGQFAADYRSVYGQLPSETLNRT